MSDLGNRPTPVLHIGWWRNGYHEYDRVEVPTVAPVSGEQTDPTDREIRQKGAMVAAAISATWFLIAWLIWVALSPDESGLRNLVGLVAAGAALSLPPSALLGWNRAISAVRSTGQATKMSVGVVLLTDLEIVIGYGIAVIVYAVTTNEVRDLWTLAFNGIVGSLLAVFFAVIVYLLGLLLFGIPGLVMAIPSALLWQRVMRRTFATNSE
jgi:hypothetical protein